MKTDLFDLHRKEGVGCISFSPLAQGVLTENICMVFLKIQGLLKKVVF